VHLRNFGREFYPNVNASLCGTMVLELRRLIGSGFRATTNHAFSL
jgi:hypothetical protein